MKESDLLDKLYHKTNGGSIQHSMANLWRGILRDLGLVEQTMGLLANYNKRYRSSKNSKEMINSSTMKANCLSDTISLKTLVGLIVNLLNAKKIDFTITITHHNGQKRSHTETLYDKRKDTNDDL